MLLLTMVSVSYSMFLELVLLRGKKFKISDDLPRHFYMGVLPGKSPLFSPG